MKSKYKFIAEVKLAKEGTIMARFQKERTYAISEMFDNKYGNGLYPTSKFFMRLDNAVKKALTEQREEMIKEIEKMYHSKTKGYYNSCDYAVAKTLDDIIKNIKEL